MSLVPENKSGEVTVLDPLDFLQFAGLGGVGKGVSIAAQGLKQFFTNRAIEKSAIQGGGQIIKTIQSSSKEIAKINPSIWDRISSTLAKPAAKKIGVAVGAGSTIAATTIPKQVSQVVTKNGISVIDKALVAGGLATVSTLALTQTPGGQNLVNTAGDTAKGISSFVQQNQTGLLLVGGLIAVAVLIGALKK